MTNLSKILTLFLLISLSVSCWLIVRVASTEGKGHKEITKHSEIHLNYYKENKPNEYAYRKELLVLKRPLAFITEVIVYLDTKKSGDDKIYIRAIIPEDMIDYQWTISYGDEAIVSSFKSKVKVLNNDVLYAVELEFDVNENDLTDQTIYIDLLNNRSILLNREMFNHIRKTLESINRETEYVHRIF